MCLMSLCKETRISAKLACALSWYKAIMLCLKYHVYIICIYTIHRLQTQLSLLHTDDVWRTGKAPLAAKQRLKGRGAPVFTCLVEVLSHDKWRVHTNAAASVDALLAGRQPDTQLRMYRNGKMVVRFETASASSGVPLRSDKACISQPPWLASLGSLASSMQVS